MNTSIAETSGNIPETPSTSNSEGDSSVQKKEVCRDKSCLRDTPCWHKRCDFPGSGE